MSVSKIFSGLMKALHERVILVMSVLFSICLCVMLVHILHLKTQLLKVVAVTSADVYTRALTEVRSLYTSEVVERVKSKGLVVSHDYKNQEGAIPLPATLSRELGERMGAYRTGEETRLYSWRKDDGGPKDSFEDEAWTYLTAHPEKTYLRFEKMNGHPVLRYATAEILRTECVECQNANPASPQKDWMPPGQMRGVLEIMLPLKEFNSLTGVSLKDTYGLMGTLALLWMGGLGLVVSKLRRNSYELEQRVEQRTAELQESNRMLEAEVYERQVAEQSLREARDYLELRVQERTAKLADANADLTREVMERKRAEEGIRKLNSDLLLQTAQLEASNKELEAFSYSVSHDLRAPLRGIDGFSQAVLEDYKDKLDENGKSYLQRVRSASQRMCKLIDAMLNLARLTRAELNAETVDMSTVAQGVVADLRKADPDRQVVSEIASGLTVTADPNLLRVVLENLLGNAWKFTGSNPDGKIEFGVTQYKSQQAYFVRDNGAGFDMTYVHKLFGAFQRLHAFSEYPGVGIGLATVQRIIKRHGGQIWADGIVDVGATFYFTL